MTVEHDRFSVFRNPDATYLFIFERDQTLLQTSPLASVSLGDINRDVVGILKQLRSRQIRFGFISNLRGMESGSEDRTDAASLTRILDEVLNTVGAKPDFWMAWRHTQSLEEGISQNNGQGSQTAAMIEQAIAWYGVEKSNCVFVGRLQKSLATAADLGIRTIPLTSSRTIWSDRQVRAKFASQIVGAKHAETFIDVIESLTRHGHL
jgi:histidinol phosphatase-like enzyme